MKVLFIHGLEGSPQGAKATHLREHFDVVAAAMDTSDFGACVEQQARLIAEHAPDVVIGSSFGGAVTAALLQRGAWRGPTLLLAPALRHFGVPLRLPPGVRVHIVHGAEDAVVHPNDSHELSASGTHGMVTLELLNDDHRLSSLLKDGGLARRVSELVESVGTSR